MRKFYPQDKRLLWYSIRSCISIHCHNYYLKNPQEKHFQHTSQYNRNLWFFLWFYNEIENSGLTIERDRQPKLLSRNSHSRIERFRVKNAVKKKKNQHICSNLNIYYIANIHLYPINKSDFSAPLHHDKSHGNVICIVNIMSYYITKSCKTAFAIVIAR